VSKALVLHSATAVPPNVSSCKTLQAKQVCEFDWTASHRKGFLSIDVRILLGMPVLTDVGKGHRIAVWEFGPGSHERVSVTDIAKHNQLGLGFRGQSCIHR